MAINNKIVIKGAKEHNLKNISLELPRDKLIVMTGLSGPETLPSPLTRFMPTVREDILKAFLHMPECFWGRWKSPMWKA